MDNLRLNVKALQDGHQGSPDPCRPAVRFEGYIWGYPPEPLVRHTKDAAGFDTIILADLIFNHSQHASLINSVRGSLERSPQSVALVFFTSHRPHLQHKDLAFFDLAREAGFAVAQVHEQVMEKPMFEVDQGDELTRRTVSGYELTWLPSSLLP